MATARQMSIRSGLVALRQGAAFKRLAGRRPRSNWTDVLVRTDTLPPTGILHLPASQRSANTLRQGTLH